MKTVHKIKLPIVLVATAVMSWVAYPDVPEGYEKHFAKSAKKSYKASSKTATHGTSQPVALGAWAREDNGMDPCRVRDCGANKAVETVECL